MNKWHIVQEDGNPIEAGTYIVILIYNEWNDGQKTDHRIACIETRYLGDADKNFFIKDWLMDDQPDHGLVWTEQVGSVSGESVYAWLEIEKAEMPTIPDGVDFQRGDEQDEEIVRYQI